MIAGHISAVKEAAQGLEIIGSGSASACRKIDRKIYQVLPKALQALIIDRNLSPLRKSNMRPRTYATSPCLYVTSVNLDAHSTRFMVGTNGIQRPFIIVLPLARTLVTDQPRTGVRRQISGVEWERDREEEHRISALFT